MFRRVETRADGRVSSPCPCVPPPGSHAAPGASSQQGDSIGQTNERPVLSSARDRYNPFGYWGSRFAHAAREKWQRGPVSLGRYDWRVLLTKCWTDMSSSKRGRCFGDQRMSERPQAVHRFAFCVHKAGHRAGLSRNKPYVLLPDGEAEERGEIRIVDSSGEGHLYPSTWFVLREVRPLKAIGYWRVRRTDTSSKPHNETRIGSLASRPILKRSWRLLGHRRPISGS